MSDVRELTVVAVRDEAPDVKSYVFADPTGADLPDWTPGAHVDVHLPPDLVRQYSLCGDPADRRQWMIAVLRESPGRGGSRYLHDDVAVGATLRIGLPRNNSRSSRHPGTCSSRAASASPHCCP
jgi:ferredoxin-NADP reductase